MEVLHYFLPWNKVAHEVLPFIQYAGSAYVVNAYGGSICIEVRCVGPLSPLLSIAIMTATATAEMDPALFVIAGLPAFAVCWCINMYVSHIVLQGFHYEYGQHEGDVPGNIF
jgi:hypothetical protein